MGSERELSPCSCAGLTDVARRIQILPKSGISRAEPGLEVKQHGDTGLGMGEHLPEWCWQQWLRRPNVLCSEMISSWDLGSKSTVRTRTNTVGAVK